MRKKNVITLIALLSFQFNHAFAQLPFRPISKEVTGKVIIQKFNEMNGQIFSTLKADDSSDCILKLISEKDALDLNNKNHLIRMSSKHNELSVYLNDLSNVKQIVTYYYTKTITQYIFQSNTGSLAKITVYENERMIKISLEEIINEYTAFRNNLTCGILL